MRLKTSVVRITLCGASLLIVACGDNGSRSGADADTDTDADSDTDTDSATDTATDHS